MVIWHYEGKVQLPTEDQFPASVLNEWSETLKAEMARIYASLLQKIPDAAAFADHIADASSDQYALFASGVPAPWDKDMIITKQRVKLGRSYPMWDAGVDAAFAPGGYFDDRVESKKNKFKLARYVLGVVGWRPDTALPYGVWNPVPMSVFLLRGDTRPIRYFKATRDVFSGVLEAALKAKEGALVTPSILAHGVQACVIAKFADELGTAEGDTLRDTILDNAVTTIKSLITLAKLTGYTIDYDLTWTEPTITVMAELTSKP